ncbi:MAG: response regulator [Ectothiorhodospiraceae bacterium]|nr:response regulator [Chromatiales bacterium]MCP5154012.1 response regulator [Ectothiorhodospiraceae bacterium]
MHTERQPAGGDDVAVLLAEDNTLNQELICDLLEETGYVVTITVDGAQALEAYRRGDYRIVLMDMQMPVMDGLTATRAIRSFERSAGRPRTPVVALTGNATEDTRRSALEAGVDAFLTKPFDLAVLMATLDEWSAVAESD